MINIRSGQLSTEFTGRHANSGFAEIHFSGREWMSQALCTQVDAEEFWPQVGDNATAARKICMRCPVRAICLDKNINEREGIFGGMSGKQRTVLRNRRSLGLPDPDPAECDHCGDPYFATGKDPRRFCSPACQRNQTKEKKQPTSAVCRNCRDRFTQKGSHNVYCSDACRHDAQNARDRAKTATQEG